jgi:hypothetical protein
MNYFWPSVIIGESIAPLDGSIKVEITQSSSLLWIMRDLEEIQSPW